MDNRLIFIKEVELLKHLPDDVIIDNLKARHFKILDYRKNNILHLEGDKCNCLEIIIKGKVSVDRIDEGGNLLSISSFYSGDILGGNLLFSNQPYYPMTVSAALDTELLEIEREVLFELLRSNPNFLRTFLKLISDRTFILGDKIKNYLNMTIRQCLLNYFEYESKRQESNCIKLTMSKKALSEKIGVQRTSLSRELAKMKKEGLIEYDKDTVTLLV